jgi:hypothetical protein
MSIPSLFAPVNIVMMKEITHILRVTLYVNELCRLGRHPELVYYVFQTEKYPPR